jgi:hypothetical protein
VREAGGGREGEEQREGHAEGQEEAGLLVRGEGEEAQAREDDGQVAVPCGVEGGGGRRGREGEVPVCVWGFVWFGLVWFGLVWSGLVCRLLVGGPAPQESGWVLSPPDQWLYPLTYYLYSPDDGDEGRGGEEEREVHQRMRHAGVQPVSRQVAGRGVVAQGIPRAENQGRRPAPHGQCCERWWVVVVVVVVVVSPPALPVEARVEPAVRQHHRRGRQQHARGQRQDAADEGAHIDPSCWW